MPTSCCRAARRSPGRSRFPKKDRRPPTGTFSTTVRRSGTSPLTSDLEGEPTLLELGALRLCLIDRGGRLGIRTWDTQSPARRTFDGIDHWPVDPAWRVAARLEPTPGRTIDVPDVLGATESEGSPGDLVFEVNGGAQSAPGAAGWRRRRAVAGLRRRDERRARPTAAAATSTPTPPEPDGAVRRGLQSGLQPALRLLAVRDVSAAVAGEPAADPHRGRGASLPRLLSRRVRSRGAAHRGRGRARWSAARRR